MKLSDILILGTVLFFLSALFSGCATVQQPTKLELDKAYYGPKPENYEEIVKRFSQGLLKDPDSAKYVFISGPEKQGLTDWDGTYFGWAVCASINAKNSYGGYTGSQPFYFIIKDSTVIFADGTFAPQVKCHEMNLSSR